MRPPSPRSHFPYAKDHQHERHRARRRVVVRSRGAPLAAGVAAGIHHLEHDLKLSLLAGGRVGSVAAGMAFVGARVERRRMTRIAGAASGLAVQLLGRVAVLRTPL